MIDMGYVNGLERAKAETSRVWKKYIDELSAIREESNNLYAKHWEEKDWVKKSEIESEIDDANRKFDKILGRCDMCSELYDIYESLIKTEENSEREAV